MKYTVIVSDQAKQMLGQHIRFLAQVNKSAAFDLKKRFLEEFRSLESFPQKYSFFNGDFIPPNKYHKLYVKKLFFCFVSGKG